MSIAKGVDLCYAGQHVYIVHRRRQLSSSDDFDEWAHALPEMNALLDTKWTKFGIILVFEQLLSAWAFELIDK